VALHDVGNAGGERSAAVDGSGPNPGCGVAFLAGIFYASGSSGMVNEVTTRNQAGGGCGVSIDAENGAGTSKSITIENSSVHNTGDGILVQSVSPPTLSATIRGNFLSNTGMDGGAKGISGIGQIEGNVITSITGEAALGIAGSDTMSGNTLADILDAAIFAGGGAMQSNKLSNVGTAFWGLGPGTVAKSNTIMNTSCVAEFLGNSSSGTFSGNVINDSAYGFGYYLGPPITGNLLYDVDTIQTTTDPLCIL